MEEHPSSIAAVLSMPMACSILKICTRKCAGVAAREYIDYENMWSDWAVVVDALPRPYHDMCGAPACYARWISCALQVMAIVFPIPIESFISVNPNIEVYGKAYVGLIPPNLTT